MDEERRLHWMYFMCTLIGMALLALVLIQVVATIRASHREDEISRRDKYVACQSIENELSRTVCLNGWGN